MSNKQKNHSNEIIDSSNFTGELNRDFFIEFNNRVVQFLRKQSIPIKSLITKIIDIDKINLETEVCLLSSFIHYVFPHMDEITSFNADYFIYNKPRFLYRNKKAIGLHKLLEFMNSAERHQFWIDLFEIWNFFSSNETAYPYIEKHYAHRSFFQNLQICFNNRSELNRQFETNNKIYIDNMTRRQNLSDSSSSTDSDSDSNETSNSDNDNDNDTNEDSSITPPTNGGVTGCEDLHNPESNQKPIANASAEPAVRDGAESAPLAEGIDEQTRENQPPFPIPGMENSIISRLAEKISKKVDPKTFEGIRNPGDLMGTLLGGGNAGLMGMMQTVCSTIDESIKSGEIRQDDLMKEAQGIMGNMGNITKGLGLPDISTLAKNMASGGGGGGASGLGGLAGMMNMMSGLMGGNGGKKNKKKHSIKNKK
jgi:hypothetical protein